jgi:hypothetical protein
MIIQTDKIYPRLLALKVGFTNGTSISVTRKRTMQNSISKLRKQVKEGRLPQWEWRSAPVMGDEEHFYVWKERKKI